MSPNCGAPGTGTQIMDALRGTTVYLNIVVSSSFCLSLKVVSCMSLHYLYIFTVYMLLCNLSKITEWFVVKSCFSFVNTPFAYIYYLFVAKHFT